jgi:hypothetical protein
MPADSGGPATTQASPPSASAAAIAQHCATAGLAPEAVELVRDDHGPQDFVAVLAEHEQHADAVRFLAHALPRREAIFWAWSSARKALEPGEPAPPIRAALEATGRWIAEPTDENRRPMYEIAEAADIGTPAGCTALSVFLSGGSIAPPEVQAVEPDYYAAAKAIAGAVILAAVSREPEKAPEKFADYIAHGLQIGQRVGLWAAAPTS